MSKHPFEGTPQWNQVYTNRSGPPVGREGNGLGFVGHRPIDSPGLEEEDTDQDAIEDADFDELYAALQRLTARQTFVIRLTHGLGGVGPYSTHQIAAIMGLSQPTVLEHYHAGLKSLYSTLSTIRFR